MPLPLRLLPLLALALALALAAACGGEEAPRGVPAAAGPRSPRLRAAETALERGRAVEARALLAELGAEAGLDGILLAARLELEAGDEVGALRTLARARERDPGDGRVRAAEAELYATLGRLAAAEEALREGWREAGHTPALERAAGVFFSCTPGGAELGLARLEKAIAADPELPYTARPLFQARLLAGRAEIARGEHASALAHAEAARAWDPADPAARELAAEALTGLHRYAEALAIYEGLEAEGRPLGATRALLHRQAATAALVGRDRAGAIEHYLAARRLGLDEAGLGFGAIVLTEEAAAETDRGAAAYAGGDLAAARTAFERALALDPASLPAQNHLGVVLFRLEDYEGAARSWTAVLAAAAGAGEELPEPVHLNLARAWHLAGDDGKARAVLSEYLDRLPDGPWSEETRELLVRLEEAALGGAREEVRGGGDPF
ncbi:MAG: tetratricopeptide repeat protein [Planctomycetota bacterium]